MKILHVNNNFHFLGGTEQYLYNICLELKSLGHKNSVIYGKSNTGTHDILDSNYHMPYLDDFNSHLRGKLKEQIKSIMDIERPDLTYLHNIHNPYVVDILTQFTPVVKYVHDHEFYCPKGIRILNDRICCNAETHICIINAMRGNGYRCMGGRSKPLAVMKKAKQLIMNKKIHHKVDQFIVASHHMKNNLELLGYEENRISVIPYYTTTLQKFVPDCGSSNILFVGRLSPEKGLDIFLDSLPILEQDFRFIIVGDGDPDYVSKLKNAVVEKKLEKKVDFVGWVGNKDLGCYYEKSAFLVVTSTWPEPFGIVGIEGMAHSRPVVAFNVGGISEWMIDNKTGLLVERNNAVEFARKMELLLKDKSLRDEFGRNAYERASTIFNKENHIQALLSVFNEVLGKKK